MKTDVVQFYSCMVVQIFRLLLMKKFVYKRLVYHGCLQEHLITQVLQQQVLKLNLNFEVALLFKLVERYQKLNLFHLFYQRFCVFFRNLVGFDKNCLDCCLIKSYLSLLLFPDFKQETYTNIFIKYFSSLKFHD